MDKIELGKLIKNRRRTLNVNQATLALLADVGLNTLVAIERGSGNPTLETILNILDTLGLKLSVTLKD